MNDRRPTSRLMPSSGTFGPLGRVICTLIVLAPELALWWLPFDFGLLGMLAYPVLIVLFLRSIWAAVPVGRPSDHEPPPSLPPDWRATPADPVIETRPAPRRW